MFRKLLNYSNLVTLSGNLFVSVLAFAAIFLLARMLNKEEFGFWILYVAGFTFMEMIRTGLIRTALVKFASGCTGRKQERIIGSSWLISLIATALFSTIIFAVYSLFPGPINTNGFGLFFTWYPLAAWLNLPWNMAVWILHAQQRFTKLMVLRTFVNLGFFIFLVAKFNFNPPLNEVVQVHLFLLSVGSFIALLNGWAQVKNIFCGTYATIEELVNFGKYSLGTLIGTNLLKSSDAFIIGILIGPAAVAVYSIPLKLLEIAEIPLRSFAMTLFPKMSKMGTNKNLYGISRLFCRHSGVFTVVYIPLVLICFFFADELVTLVGGAKYADSAIVFRVLLISVALLPFDRFVGITLDSLNRPNVNMKKVSMMVTLNAIGNVVAIAVIGELWAVAAVTILNILAGAIYGIFQLRKSIQFKITQALLDGTSLILKMVIYANVFFTWKIFNK